MAIVQTVNLNAFRDAFRKMERNNFSYEGQKALFDYLENYSEDSGQSVELDPIALCCEYTEYSDIEEFWGNYDQDDYPTFDDIRNNTQLIFLCDDESGESGFIIADF